MEGCLPGGTRPNTPHHHMGLWLQATVQMRLCRGCAQGGVWWKRVGGRAGARQGRTAQNSGRMFVFAATLVPRRRDIRHGNVGERENLNPRNHRDIKPYSGRECRIEICPCFSPRMYSPDTSTPHTHDSRVPERQLYYQIIIIIIMHLDNENVSYILTRVYVLEERPAVYSHGPCLLHQRLFHWSSGGALVMTASAGASTPEVHGMYSGIGPDHTSSRTECGQISRGAKRILGG